MHCRPSKFLGDGIILSKSWSNPHGGTANWQVLSKSQLYRGIYIYHFYIPYLNPKCMKRGISSNQFRSLPRDFCFKGCPGDEVLHGLGWWGSESHQDCKPSAGEATWARKLRWLRFHGETHRNRVVKYGNMIYKWRVLKEKTTFLMEILVDFFHL
jgi:hypothetical protein